MGVIKPLNAQHISDCEVVVWQTRCQLDLMNYTLYGSNVAPEGTRWRRFALDSVTILAQDKWKYTPVTGIRRIELNDGQ